MCRGVVVGGEVLDGLPEKANQSIDEGRSSGGYTFAVKNKAKGEDTHLDLHRPQIRRDLLQHLIRLRSPTHPGALIRIRIQTQQTRRRSLSFFFLDPLRRFLFREVV